MHEQRQQLFLGSATRASTWRTPKAFAFVFVFAVDRASVQSVSSPLSTPFLMPVAPRRARVSDKAVIPTERSESSDLHLLGVRVLSVRGRTPFQKSFAQFMNGTLPAM